MKQLNKLSPVTLQQQLRDEIVSGIRNGTWCPGDQIPTEYELSKMYDVSRVTVRGAISQLVSENILVRKAGKGTFVKEAAPYQEGINMGSSFSANCLSRNVRPSTVIARHSIRKAEGEESGLADDNGNITKMTNHAGGILGGISDGSDVLVRAYFKPTPSIFKEQKTVNKSGENISINIKGRHDPIIVPRAVVVVESMVALTVLDMLLVSMTSDIEKIKKFFE